MPQPNFTRKKKTYPIIVLWPFCDALLIGLEIYIAWAFRNTLFFPSCCLVFPLLDLSPICPPVLLLLSSFVTRQSFNIGKFETKLRHHLLMAEHTKTNLGDISVLERVFLWKLPLPQLWWRLQFPQWRATLSSSHAMQGRAYKETRYFSCLQDQ